VLSLLLQQLQSQLPQLGLPQSSRALVASVALGYNPPEPWIHSYMQRFRASLSELNPEGLVDVLRALSAANALPSHQWLTEFEQDLERRWVWPAGTAGRSSRALQACSLAVDAYEKTRLPVYLALPAIHEAAPACIVHPY